MTLVEILVVVAIIVLLVAILLPSISAVRNRAKKDAARAQMQMIAMAIDEFARFWPPHKTGTSKDLAVTDLPICSKALPPWRPCEFLSSPTLDDRNAFISLNDASSALTANECLAYSLTAKIGNGPYLKKPPGGMLETLSDVYPFNSNETIRRLLDPWGTPYFYCWAAEDGMWLVLENFAALHSPWPGPPGPDQHFVAEELAYHQGHTAVLISAGPNKTFDFLSKLPVAGDQTTILGSRVKTWPGDDVVLGQ